MIEGNTTTEVTSKTMEKDTLVRGATCSSSDDWSDMKSRIDCLRLPQTTLALRLATMGTYRIKFSKDCSAGPWKPDSWAFKGLF